jgi:ribosomal protein L16 Arg81 hydroxylase
MKKPLEFILGDTSQEEFLAKYYQQQALHIKGKSDKFKDLFDWSSLNNVLNSVRHPHKNIKMSQNGTQFKPSDATAIISAAQQGASLIVEHIGRHDTNLGYFLNRLTAEINEETRFNMYLSQPDNQAYDNHYDTQDFFIFQVSGYKEWCIYPETIESALFHQKEHGRKAPPEDSLYLNCTLSPGDVLYVPQGHWHYAIAKNEPSVHLTLAMFVKTGIDFLNWLADELTGNKKFRKALPLILSPDKNCDSEGSEGFERLKSELEEVLEKGDLWNKFLDYRSATNNDRQAFNFPSHISPPQNYSGDSLFERRVNQVRISDCREADKIKLISSGRLLKFNKSSEALVRFMFTSHKFSFTGLNEVTSEVTKV